MNEEMFLRSIVKTRDCEEEQLVRAVKRGLSKAKNSGLDKRKFFALAAAGIFTLAICFSVNLEPVQSAADAYYRARYIAMPNLPDALSGYAQEMESYVKYFLGGI